MLRELVTIAIVFLLFFGAAMSCAYLANGSETEIIRDAKGRPTRIFVCNINNYTTSCNDNSGSVYIPEVPDAG